MVLIFFEVNVNECNCQVKSCKHTPAQTDTHNPPHPGWYSDAIQSEERGEGLLYPPYGGEVWYSLSLCLANHNEVPTHEALGLSLSLAPSLSLFILNCDKEVESDRGRWGLENRRGEKNNWEALGWREAGWVKGKDRKKEGDEKGTWGRKDERLELRERVGVKEARKRGSVREEKMKERGSKTSDRVCVCGGGGLREIWGSPTGGGVQIWNNLTHNRRLFGYWRPFSMFWHTHWALGTQIHRHTQTHKRLPQKQTHQQDILCSYVFMTFCSISRCTRTYRLTP